MSLPAGSALYRGHLMHDRVAPLRNRFRYPIYLCALELGELDRLPDRLRLFGRNRRNLYSVWDRDYTGAAEIGIEAAVRAFIRERGGPRDVERIVLLTHARVLGYVFNPVSFFLGFGRGGGLSCVVAEVHNHYGGRHRYLLDERSRRQARRGDAFAHDKEFFVSPFIHDARTYEFRFALGAERLDVHMQVRGGDGGLILTAHLGGERLALTDRSLLSMAVRYPLITARVTARIHWQALKLWHRGLEYRRPEGYVPPYRSFLSRAGAASGESFGRRALARLLRGWRHGCLELVLPGGEQMIVGDPHSAERGVCQIRDSRFISRVLLRGEMGAGEAYVDGQWDSPDLVALLKVFRANLEHLQLETPLTWLGRLAELARHRGRANAVTQSERNIHAHYDLGNELYQLFLDSTMSYSCALFATPHDTLERAQENKIDRLLDMLELEAGDHLLEIGCGWGGLAIRAARTRGCRVTAVTISSQQYELARRRVREAGLDDRVRIERCDYRRIAGRYDKLVSVEMIEAVGYEYLDGYFDTCSRLLRPGGHMALQSIIMPDERFDRYRRNVDWSQAYIFPGSLIPSLGAIESSVRRASTLSITSLDDIGESYAPTLAAWRQRFTGNLERIRALGFDQRFERLWLLYLAWSEAQFATGKLRDYQILLEQAA